MFHRCVGVVWLGAWLTACGVGVDGSDISDDEANAEGLGIPLEAVHLQSWLAMYAQRNRTWEPSAVRELWRISRATWIDLLFFSGILNADDYAAVIELLRDVELPGLRTIHLGSIVDQQGLVHHPSDLQVLADFGHVRARADYEPSVRAVSSATSSINTAVGPAAPATYYGNPSPQASSSVFSSPLRGNGLPASGFSFSMTSYSVTTYTYSAPVSAPSYRSLQHNHANL